MKDCLFNKGNAFYYQDNYAQAIQYDDKALAIDPNYKQALDNKQYALSKQDHSP
jgi:tetratricopeptide (TPR) repeat protein